MLLRIPALEHQGNDYAQLYNDAMDVVDAHDHSEGSGVKIRPGGMNINSDLTFGNNAATELSRAQFTETGTILTGATYVNSLHFYDDEAYIVDGTGNSIKLTSDGYLNVTTSGGWSGLASPAEANYSGITKIFRLLQDNSGSNNQAGILDVGDIKLRTTGTNRSIYTTLAASVAQASSFTITMPSSLPASTSVVTITSAGQLASTRAVSVDTVAATSVSATSITTTGDLTVGDDLVVNDDTTLTGALTVNGDADFNGVVTLPDGTSLNHGTMFLHIPAFTGFEGTGGGTFEADGTWQSNGALDTITIPIPLHRGDRITSIDIDGLFGGTGARTRTLLNAGGSDIWTSSASVASGSTTITLTGSAHTLVQHEYLVVRFSSLSSNDEVQGITVTYDRP